MATNRSHWLKVQSSWFKNYIFVKLYFNQLMAKVSFVWLLLFPYGYNKFRARVSPEDEPKSNVLALIVALIVIVPTS